MTNLRTITAIEATQENWIELLENVETVPVLLMVGAAQPDGSLGISLHVPQFIDDALAIQALEEALRQLKAGLEEQV